MFHIYFLGSSEGLIFDVPTANFDSAPLESVARLPRGAGRARSGSALGARASTRGRPKPFLVQTDSGDDVDADAVVLATDVAGLQRIVAASTGLGHDLWRAQIARLRTAPPFVVHRLWLDRPVAATAAGVSGHRRSQPLDNISVLERYEREAADWARAHRRFGRRIALVRNGCRRRRARPRCASCTRCTRKPQRRESFTSGCCVEAIARCSPREPTRTGPTVVTPQPGLVLAGDGIRIDLPVALMERAATTGWSRRQPFAEQWGLAGHALCTVPTRGRSPLLRWLGGPRRTRTEHEHRRTASTPEAGLAERLAAAGDSARRRGPASARPTATHNPRIINAALDRAQQKPTGNWYVVRGEPRRAQRAGRSARVWPASDWSPGAIEETGRLIVGPRSCPHLGADLATGAVRGGVLICRWHGLALDGNAREFGWRPLPSHDDGMLAWVRLDSVGGEAPLGEAGGSGPTHRRHPGRGRPNGRRVRARRHHRQSP